MVAEKGKKKLLITTKIKAIFCILTKILIDGYQGTF
jgi:hypothetical protein